MGKLGGCIYHFTLTDKLFLFFNNSTVNLYPHPFINKAFSFQMYRKCFENVVILSSDCLSVLLRLSSFFLFPFFCSEPCLRAWAWTLYQLSHVISPYMCMPEVHKSDFSYAYFINKFCLGNFLKFIPLVYTFVCSRVWLSLWRLSAT